MAGKHQAIDLDLTSPPVYPGSRTDRAYSEGRENYFTGGDLVDNPHVSGTPEYVAWGFAFTTASGSTGQIQTAYVVP